MGNISKLQPTVSVIIPTYNHAEFLREALESLRAQSFEDWEAIVVNNFSEDETISVVESFSDTRIRLENFRNHGVIAASRNYGISLVKGELLAFLDSDDLWYPEKLARCIECLDEGVDLVCHGLRTFGDGQEVEVFAGPESCATYEALLYRGNCLTPSATVVRKKIVTEVGGFSEDPEKITSEDYHLWIKLAQAGARMKFTRSILGRYRIHSGNQSGSIIKHLNSIIAVVEDFFPDVSEQTVFTWIRIRRRFSIAYYGAGRELQKQGRCHEACLQFLRASICWPFYLKIYIAALLNITCCNIGRWLMR